VLLPAAVMKRRAHVPVFSTHASGRCGPGSRAKPAKSANDGPLLESWRHGMAVADHGAGATPFRGEWGAVQSGRHDAVIIRGGSCENIEGDFCAGGENPDR
jgi:hypothetical protein